MLDRTTGSRLGSGGRLEIGPGRSRKVPGEIARVTMEGKQWENLLEEGSVGEKPCKAVLSQRYKGKTLQFLGVETKSGNFDIA